MLTNLLLVLALHPVSAGQPAPAHIRNGGFETTATKGSPMEWIRIPGFGPASLTTDFPHGGKQAARIVGDGRQRAWRQVIEQPATRIYSASGWFRATHVVLDPNPNGYARFYFHILYRNRPYSEGTQLWTDIPPGTYGWRRLTVQLTPKSDYPIAEIWVTVAGRLKQGTLDFDDLTLQPCEPRGGFNALEWTRAGEATVIRDLSRVEPSSALSETPKRGKWYVIPYEAGGYAGKMLWASEGTDAPPVRLPLKVTGWHAVFVGMASPAGIASRLLLRLSGDPAFVPRLRTAGQIEEVFFKVADLTGQSLVVAQQDDDRCVAGGIAYVKLIPLTSAENARVKAERAEPSLRRLVTSIDGFSFIYGRRPLSRRALLQEVEVYRNTDFGTLMLQMGGADMVNYPSRVGCMVRDDLDDFPRAGDRRYAETLRTLAKKGINPTRTLIEGARNAGMKVFVCIRPGAWQHSPPLDHFFDSPFFEAHPEWRCFDRDGEEVPRMSFAVPQVRAHLVAVLREAVRFGADGAGIVFVRGVPVVLFEKPFCDLFRKRYGVDARTVEEDDPRLHTLRCEVVTQFMREVRQMLDLEGERQGRRLEQAAYVMGAESDNLRFGFDVATWSKEGLVDLVCPYCNVGGAKVHRYDLAFYKRVCSPHDVKVAPTFVTWRLPPLESVVKKSLTYYAAGADGISFWDGNSAAARMPVWAVLSRLGHIAELEQRAGEGPPKPVTSRFHRLGRLRVDGPYSPIWGY